MSKRKVKQVISWKGSIVSAQTGTDNIAPQILHLVTLIWNAEVDRTDKKAMCILVQARAKETVQWLMSSAAGDQQITDMAKLSEHWIKAINKTKQAIAAGVDFNKIKTWHDMLKAMSMLKGGEEVHAPGSQADIDARVEVALAAKLREIEAVASGVLEEEVDEDAAANDGEPAPEVETEVEEEEVVTPEGGTVETEAEKALREAQETLNNLIKTVEEEKSQPKRSPAEEPTLVEPQVPAIVESILEGTLTDEEILEVAGVIQAVLSKDGKLPGIKQIRLMPLYLIGVDKLLSQLTEGKRNEVLKAVNKLLIPKVKAHITELGKTKAGRHKLKLMAQSADADVPILLPEDEVDKAPPVRAAKPDSAFSDEAFGNVFG